VPQTSAGQCDKAERVVVRVTAEKCHQSGYRVSHAHSKYLDEEILLFREIAGVDDHVVEAQRLARPATIGAVDALHVGYQFNGIALGIAKPKQPADPRLHVAIRSQINSNAVVPEDLRGSIEFLVTRDFECNVMKSPLVSH
jgi:hypothetical protein